MTSAVSTEEVFRQLADTLALNSSPCFFADLAERIATLLRLDHVVIAAVDSTEAHTLAVWSDGRPVENIRYALSGTPCETVIGASACFYPDSVCECFPDDTLLREMGAEGYFGVPMVAQSGKPVGLLAVLSNDPLTLSGLAQEVLRLSAAQAGTELGRRQAEASLRESERRLHTLMNHLPGMAYRCCNDRDWTMEFVSQGVEALTGYSADALIDNHQVAFARLIHPADRDRIDREVQSAVRRGQPYRCIYRLINRRGETRWIWEQGQGVAQDDDGEVLLEGFITDITEQHESERVQEAVVQTATAITSRLGADYFQQLVRHLARALDADVGFISTLQDGDWMETLARVVAGVPVDNLRYPLSESPCWNVMDEGECVGHYDPPMAVPDPHGGKPLMAHTYVGRRLDNANGEPIGTLMVVYARPMPDLGLATSVLRILAAGAAGELERQTNDQRMYQLAYVDGTTALPNRIHFMERLTSELDRARRDGQGLGLVFLDLKRFKEINDVLGHDIGDRLLAAVARRLEQVLRPGDFLARLSGDEFALLAPGLDEEALSGLINRCRDKLASPVVAAEREFALDVTIGAACYPTDAMTPADLLQCASVAMHEAKRSERNACAFDVSMAEALNRRRALAERFVRALEERRLSLRYQPQVDLRTGQLVGAEVLCRWHDEHWGWVSPGEFIPLAEERGLIQAMGNWVLQAASEQVAQWRGRGHPLPGRLSVNVSALQFDRPALADDIVRLTRAVEPQAIGLELTESGFMRDPELAVAITERLQEAGFGLSVDDFGTGYSSLTYLRRFAADTLKIDMSFVREMLSSASDYTLVTTVIAMAHSLGMRAVAEGVETEAQARALARLGCDQAQGFLYDRPLDGETFAERWLVDGLT